MRNSWFWPEVSTSPFGSNKIPQTTEFEPSTLMASPLFEGLFDLAVLVVYARTPSTKGVRTKSESFNRIFPPFEMKVNAPSIP